MSEVMLAENGHARAVIRIRKKASASDRHAAERLQFYLKQVTGADFSIAEHTRNETTLHVGRSGEVDKLLGPFDWERLGEDGILLRTLGPHIVIAGNGARGTLYAVYEFLERVFGCRWLAPGEPYIPSQPAVTLPQLHVAYTPAFIYREPYSHILADPEWAAANRANGALPRLEARHGGKWEYARDFVHNFFNLVPPERYFDSHPEYFSELNGVRVHAGAQLCLSNPDVRQIATEACRRVLREHPGARIMTVSQMDWGGWCTCPACRRVDEAEGGPSGSILAFVNTIAERLEQEFPAVRFDTLAYTYSVHPPRTIRPRPNVIVRLCNMGACDSHTLERCERNRTFVELLNYWKGIAPTIFVWDYFNNFHQYFQPYPNLDKIISDIPFYAAHNVKGLMCQLDGWPTKGAGDMVQLRGYLLCRLMWDPSRDGDALIDEFCRLYYGPAAEPIRDYLNHLQSAPRKQADCHFSLYNPLMHPMFTPDWIQRATQLFDAAENKAKDIPVLLNRVMAARLPVEYLRWRPATRFAVRGSRFTFENPAQQMMVRRFFTHARTHGAQALREGGAPLQEEERIRQPQSVETLNHASMRIQVIPALGGRLLSLKDETGAEWFHRPEPLDLDSPVAGGYEEYTGRRWRTPGWIEPHECRREGQTLRLTATLAEGLSVDRTYTLDPADTRGCLVIETRLTNGGAKPCEAVIRSHPVLDPGDWSQATIVARNADGSFRSLAPWQQSQDPAGSQWLEKDQVPAGAWSLQRGSRRLVVRFDAAEVEKGLVDWNRADRVLNMELFGRLALLEPGQSLHLRQEWQFEPATP